MMKKLRIGFILLFFLLLLCPAAAFNREKHVISKIDNRTLMESPFEGQEGEDYDLFASLEAYAEDRIGFRDQMISLYTSLNDQVFHEMVHPTYIYGKDDYVFFRPSDNMEFQDYHVKFADMILTLQTYFEDRGIPFLFVFEPAKATVLQEELQEGINCNNDWVAQFFQELDKRGVHYVDNTQLLCDKEASGEAVFNKQYDAGHWNDLGAFYGVNQVLEKLSEMQEGIHINSLDEFEIGEEVKTSLLVSDFKIHDQVPVFQRKEEVLDLTGEYDKEVIREDAYPYFHYTQNPLRQKEGSPSVLVFQGSYINEYGAKFFENSFGEYIGIHDYQNVFHADYYANIFQPDCVIFETAEYTMLDDYFSYDSMFHMYFNPEISSFDDLPEETHSLSELTLEVKPGNRVSAVTAYGLPPEAEHAYLEMDGRMYDLIWVEDTVFTTDAKKENIRLDDAKLTAICNGKRLLYTS